MLVGDRKRSDDALDGFRGIDGVQRGQDKVAGFRGFESDFNGFPVAHFADEDNLGSLTQGAAKSERKRRRVAVQLALVDGGLFMFVQKLDGIFDGEDVVGLFHIHFVDDGG